MKHLKTVAIIYLAFLVLSFQACSQNSTPNNKPGHEAAKSALSKQPLSKYKVTFIELGSVRCIPCKKMQAVMKSVEQKYGDQVKVVFYDVWTPQGEPYGDKYKITAIPAQVLLDADGVEFYRHEGYIPEEDLVKVLNQKGVH
jgi:thioredoxin 1